MTTERIIRPRAARRSRPKGNERAPEWRIAGPWLTAPARLTKLMATALLLSTVTGVLYSWGSTYYWAFINEMGLSGSHYAFQVQPQEAIVAGAYVLVFFIKLLPDFLSYIALGLVTVIVLVLAADLISNPSRERSIKFFSRFPASLRGSRPGSFWESWGYSAETERAFGRIGWAVASYFCFAALLALLMMLLGWGENRAEISGREAARSQLAKCRSASVDFNDGKALAGELCGRIGSDYIMRVPKESSKEPPPQQSQQPQQRIYVLVKESAVKQVNLY
jgi:hypothetical protein